VHVHVQDLREFTRDRHKTVDDRPFGGGEGMVLKPEPLFEAVEKLLGQSMGDSAREPALPRGIAVVLLSAAGKMFRQETARRLAKLERIVLICGRYEGVDERVAEHLATEEISVGDYVLSGGELPAAVVLDAVTRLLPGALGNEASTENESFRKLETDDSISMADNSHLRKTRLLLDYPPLHAPGRVSWLEGAGCPDRRASRRSGQMARPASCREDPAKPARPFGILTNYRNRASKERQPKRKP